MEKIKKFEILRRIGLTVEEAREYFSQQQVSLAPNMVSTPLDLIYVNKSGGIEVMPVLDKNRLSEVWGIKVGEWGIKLTHEEDLAYVEAQDCFLDENKKSPSLKVEFLSLYVCTLAHKMIDAFDETVAILCQYGVPVEKWKDGYYWCGSFNCKYSYIYSVTKGTESAAQIRDVKHHVRFAMRLREFNA